MITQLPVHHLSRKQKKEKPKLLNRRVLIYSFKTLTKLNILFQESYCLFEGILQPNENSRYSAFILCDLIEKPTKVSLSLGK